MCRLAVLTLVMIAIQPPLPAWSQGPEPLRGSKTLGEALSIAGVSDAAAVPGAPDLVTRLTSSAFMADGDLFAAAYYFAEAERPNTLGQLHVSTFDRAAGRWVHARDLGARAEGSAMSVERLGPYLSVRLHWGPAGVRRRVQLRRLS